MPIVNVPVEITDEELARVISGESILQGLLKYVLGKKN